MRAPRTEAEWQTWEDARREALRFRAANPSYSHHIATQGRGRKKGEAHPHGTHQRYNRGCYCESCSAAARSRRMQVAS